MSNINYFTSVPIQSTYLQNGYSFDINGVETGFGKGVYIPPIVNYEVVPAASTNNYVCVTQPVTAGVPMTLNSANDVYVNNVQNVLMDCSRGFRIDCIAPVVAPVTFTFSGYTINGKFYQQNATVLAGSATQFTTFAMRRITSIVTNVDVANVQIGTSDVMGLPYLIDRFPSVVSFFWGNPYSDANVVSNVFANAGTLIIGNRWRANGRCDLTSGDPNGTINIPGASYQPDGVNTLKLAYYAYGADSSLNAQIANEVGGNFPFALPTNTPSAVPLSISGIRTADISRNTSNTSYVYPTLLSQDLIGPAYPTDAAFVTEYARIKAL